MPSQNEALIWESAPRSIGISQTGTFIRCPAEVAPKRVSEPKLVASLARAAFVPYPTAIRSGPVVCPDADKGLVRSLLRDLPLVTFLSSDWSSVMKWLTKITSVQVATIVGGQAVHREPDLERFAESLLKFNPDWQKAALQRAATQLNAEIDAKQPSECIIAEERPGKLVRVEPRASGLKFLHKKWQSLLSKESELRSRAVMAEAGWGAGSLIVEPEGARQLVCGEFDISGKELHLAAVEPWVKRIRAWMSDRSGLRPEDLSHVVISTPFFVVAGYLADALTDDNREQLSEPDFTWGWHPLMTLLEFLTTAKGPSILINLHHGSGLQVALLW